MNKLEVVICSRITKTHEYLGTMKKTTMRRFNICRISKKKNSLLMTLKKEGNR